MNTLKGKLLTKRENGGETLNFEESQMSFGSECSENSPKNSGRQNTEANIGQIQQKKPAPKKKTSTTRFKQRLQLRVDEATKAKDENN